MENKELDLQEIVKIEQLPKIKQQLQLISQEIDNEVEYALSLECNEDTVKEVKKERAKINKVKLALEERRKEIKNAVMKPYEEFEVVYNELVKGKLLNADNELKNKVDNVETQLKQDKRDEIELFAKQHLEFNEIDFVSFDDMNINVTISSSMKSLKEQVLAFIEKIVNDMKLIEIEEFKDEILVEYKDNLDFTQSKLNVYNRHKQLEELKHKQEQQNEVKKQEEKVVEKVEEIVDEIKPPVEIINDDEIISATFTIVDTKENIIKVREFMKKEGIRYE